jgi:hypothetical protein
MNDLDLDINNYTTNDLEKFFGLSSSAKITAEQIENNAYRIREQLLKSGHVNKRFKRDLIAFLENAQRMLIHMKCPPRTQPTTMPSNWQLDKTDAPKGALPQYHRELDLIKPQDQPYINTMHSEFNAGSLNPLAARTITKCVTVDTKFRENLYMSKSSDFTMQLPQRLNKVVSMQLNAIELPVSFYGISSTYGNNFFFITVNSMDDRGKKTTVVKEVVIPDGNYNAPDLIAAINNAISPVDASGNLLFPANMLSYVAFNFDVSKTGAGTAKVTVKTVGKMGDHIENITLDFSRNLDGETYTEDIKTRLGWSLGFIRPMYTGMVFYTSDTIIEPAPIRYIYLAIDDFNKSANSQFITGFDKVTINPNIIARISVRATYFSLIMENNLNIVTEPRKYFGPVDIQKLRIQVFDEFGRILEMNNSNFSFCLVFKMLYDTAF